VRKIYQVVNSAVSTAAAPPTPVTTGTSIKALLQFATSANREATILSHFVTFDGYAAALPIKYELIGHASGAATVTAFVAADISKWSDPNSVASAITAGTSASGYTASAEGTAVTLRQLDFQLIPPTSGAYFDYDETRAPEIAVSTFARQRVLNGGTAVNAVCGLRWAE